MSILSDKLSSRADARFLDSASEMAALIRNHDWASTPLGPISTWPQSLRTTVSLCLASNFPINIVWGPDHIQLYNDGYRVLCGDRHPATLGMDYKVCWESAWSALEEPFEQAVRGQTSYLENQRMFLFRNGYLEETFFTFSLSPIRDESGEIGGLFHPVTETTPTMIADRRTRAVRDLTARLVAAESRADVFSVAGRTLQAFDFDLPFLLLYELDAAKAGYALTERSGIELSPATAPAELRPGMECFWPVDRLIEAPEMIELEGLRAALRGERCGPYPEAPEVGFGIPIMRPGVARPVALLLTAASARQPLTDEFRGFLELLGAALGAALARVAVIEDERRRLEALAEIDRAKTKFFSNVSHEFRTPLTLMLGPLEDLLGMDGLSAPQHALLATANRNAQRLLKLVNALLDFSRMEMGRAAVSLKPTDLAATTAELASHFSSACERAGLALEIDCPPLPEPVWVDRDMWEKIVFNLLSNAFKFTLRGGIAVRLRISDGAAELVVADTGLGVPKAELGRVFERFHRIEGQRGRSMEGTGIGLALVSEMVALHEGSISLDSEVDQGATFRVRMPLGVRAAGAVHAEAAEAAGSRQAPAYVNEALQWIAGHGGAGMGAPEERDASVAGGASQGRILLADDNNDMIAYIQRALEKAGYAVTAVANGAEALEWLRRQPLPDLMISDVMMPRLDGFALLEKVREDARMRELPVLLLSARAGEEARIEGLAAGADDYVVKPFSVRELLARVEGAIRLARLRRDAVARETALRFQVESANTRSALRRSEAHMASLFEQTAVGIVEADLSGRLARVNARYCQIVGRGADELVGMHMKELIHPDDWPANLALLTDMDANGGSFEIENRYVRPEGQQVWVTKAVARVPGVDADDPGAVLAVVLDISDRKQNELKLREADRNKDEFLAMLAHELRNPLAPISAAAEVIGRGRLDDERLKRTSGIISRQARHMSALVDDLLDVSRVTRGLVSIERTPLDMNAIVANAVEQTRPLMTAREHLLTLTRAPGPAMVMGDQKRLVQVLANLLNNAAKFTPPGGRIELRLDAGDGADGRVLVSVRDSGIGIAAELKDRMFDLFAQAKRTPDRSQGGLGLGLALAKSLVELHGGGIDFVSEGPNKGSLFTVSLPASRQDLAVAPADRSPQASDAGGALRIMLVDDNVDAAGMLAMLLEVQGYLVHVEHEPHAALAAATAAPPDVCILDIGLPDMDGNELARRLRARPGTRGAKLIAVTGYGEQRDIDASFAAGFDAFFSKPVDSDKLHRLLEEVAAKR
jgi:PAS domain S-box-containing protein